MIGGGVTPENGADGGVGLEGGEVIFGPDMGAPATVARSDPWYRRAGRFTGLPPARRAQCGGRLGRRGAARLWPA